MFPAVPGWVYLLGASLALGMLHGVIPDEHTWPITFSYSVGSATGRGGMLSGAYFAAAFTVQRAIMSQLVYFALVTFLAFNEALNGPVYVAVGLAMSLAGYLILRDKLPHWHPLMWISTRDRERHLKKDPAGSTQSQAGLQKTLHDLCLSRSCPSDAILSPGVRARRRLRPGHNADPSGHRVHVWGSSAGCQKVGRRENADLRGPRRSA